MVLSSLLQQTKHLRTLFGIFPSVVYYSAVQINLANGCVMAGSVRATFDPVYLYSRVEREGPEGEELRLRRGEAERDGDGGDDRGRRGRRRRHRR